MKCLNEKELKALMMSDAYSNSYNQDHNKTIGIVTQGWKNLYPEDDRNNNPQNYYIWRAVGDDKTRSSHAERDGQVFSWDNPPDAGHPGEDYNCRCTAEKYIPSQDGMCEYDWVAQRENHNYLPGELRIKALKEGKLIKLSLKNNPEATGDWPIYHSHPLGKGFVEYYNDKIERYAKKHNVDVDLVKAVMYAENATGHKGGLNYIADFVGKSGSQSPMNIQGSTWSGIDGKYFNSKDADQNIELSVMVLKRIYEALDDPTPTKIGTLWNGTGQDQVSKFGARIGKAYRNKSWLRDVEGPGIK